MPDSVLPPSRFGAGYTVGAASSAAAAPVAGPRQSPPYSPAPPPAASPPAAPSTDAPINSLALASFVLVLLMGPFIAPVTIPLSMIARGRIAHTGAGGAGLAKAALAISCIYLVAAAAVIALMLLVTPAGSP